VPAALGKQTGQALKVGSSTFGEKTKSETIDETIKTFIADVRGVIRRNTGPNTSAEAQVADVNRVLNECGAASYKAALKVLFSGGTGHELGELRKGITTALKLANYHLEKRPEELESWTIGQWFTGVRGLLELNPFSETTGGKDLEHDSTASRAKDSEQSLKRLATNLLQALGVTLRRKCCEKPGDWPLHWEQTDELGTKQGRRRFVYETFHASWTGADAIHIPQNISTPVIWQFACEYFDRVKPSDQLPFDCETSQRLGVLTARLDWIGEQVPTLSSPDKAAACLPGVFHQFVKVNSDAGVNAWLARRVHDDLGKQFLSVSMIVRQQGLVGIPLGAALAGFDDASLVKLSADLVSTLRPPQDLTKENVQAIRSLHQSIQSSVKGRAASKRLKALDAEFERRLKKTR